MNKTSTLDWNDWFFFEVLASKNCKNETLNSLKYNYSLPEFITYKEYVEILDAYDSAINRDLEEENKNKPK